MSRLRLFLITGCLAIAAASTLSGIQLSFRAALVGAALVAAVLLLAIRRDPVVVHHPGVTPPDSPSAREPRVPQQGAAAPRRRFRRRNTDELDARVAAIARQLEGYEETVRELSRVQAAADIATKHELGNLQQQLAQLEAANEEQRATIASLREQHAQRLARLHDTVAGQRKALESLESTLETALAPALDAQTAATDPAD
jgi:flagellar biosynthesis chaperone FliJ